MSYIQKSNGIPCIRPPILASNRDGSFGGILHDQLIICGGGEMMLCSDYWKEEWLPKILNDGFIMGKKTNKYYKYQTLEKRYLGSCVALDENTLWVFGGLNYEKGFKREVFFFSDPQNCYTFFNFYKIQIV